MYLSAEAKVECSSERCLRGFVGELGLNHDEWLGIW